MDENKIKVVTITLTQNCNLSCTYCYEHNKSQKIMDFETAKSIVDKELSVAEKDMPIEFPQNTN